MRQQHWTDYKISLWSVSESVSQWILGAPLYLGNGWS